MKKLFSSIFSKQPLNTNNETIPTEVIPTDEEIKACFEQLYKKCKTEYDNFRNEFLSLPAEEVTSNKIEDLYWRTELLDLLQSSCIDDPNFIFSYKTCLVLNTLENPFECLYKKFYVNFDKDLSDLFCDIHRIKNRAFEDAVKSVFENN